MYTTGSAAALPFRNLWCAHGWCQNVLTVDPYEIGNTVSELTVMNGVVVYEK